MDAVLFSGLVNLGYLVVGILALYGLVRYANHSGITGKSFHLATWLDSIADVQTDGKPGPSRNPVAMGVVIAGILLAGAVLASAFIRG